MSNSPADDQLRSELRARRLRWRAAEARVYPIAMVNADGYQRAVAAIAELMAYLRAEINGHQELIDVSDEPSERARALADEAGPGIDPVDLINAACAGRDREIVVNMQLNRRIVAIEGAVAAGHRWVDVAVAPSELPGGRAPQFPELRIHLRSGLAIYTSEEIDPDTAIATPMLMVVRVDLGTGNVLEIVDAIAEPIRASDGEAWVWLADTLAAAIEQAAS